MKHIISLISLVALAASVFAQAPAPVQTSINGTINIAFNTRTQRDGSKPKEGVTDKYQLNVNVSNSALFRGSIDVLPFIDNTITDQQGKMTYSMECDVVNPANPSQTRNVGRLYGIVPIDEKNQYRFSDGNLKIGVLDMGNAKGFESAFKGYALGKPPATTGLLDRVKKEAIKLQKSVNGKNVSIAVTKYDKMEFRQHVLAAGPVKIYGEVTVTGIMLYDYNRSVWHFQNLNIEYYVEGRLMRDTLSGNIRWVDGAKEYQFDVRVNEPVASEANIFDGPQDESAFFSQDNNVPALTGTMKYKDSVSGDVVTASAVQIALTGNKLTKQQAMYLAKLLLLSSIVPLNAE